MVFAPFIILVAVFVELFTEHPNDVIRRYLSELKKTGDNYGKD